MAIDNRLSIILYTLNYSYFFHSTFSSNNTFKTLFLCRLKPSHHFSCSAVDPSWHFSAGAHEASCHWQMETLQLQTKLKEGCFHCSLYLCAYRRSFSASPSEVTGCVLPVILLFSWVRTHILVCTYVHKKSLNLTNAVFSPLESYNC